MEFDINMKHKLLLKSAKTRGIKVNINLKHFQDILSLGCMYCGSDLSKENGYCLDRIDNKVGYLDHNVTPCCKICNMAKGTKTVSEFINWIEKAYKFQNKTLENLKKINPTLIKKETNIYFNKKELKNSHIIKLSV